MLYRKVLNIRDFSGYVFSQVSGAVVGVVVANLMYDLPTLTVSETERVTTAHLLSEVVATAGLVGLIVALIMTTNTKAIPAAVSGWVFAAILFTSSTAFANPAVTIGRSLTSSVTGIAPASAVAFILVQFVGAVIGLIVSEVFLAKEKS
jgi:arsenate reductase